MNENDYDSDNPGHRFISMLSDFGFKITFGNEHNSRFLKRALQALISSEDPIEKVEFTKNEVTGITKDGRGGLFDVTCMDEKGRTFIVEMQLFGSRHFIHRAKFYAFHKFNTFVRRGNYRFNNLNRIYTISILAGKAYGTDLYHQVCTLKNQDGETVDDQITHVIVELDKFKKALKEIGTDLEKLLYMMKLTHTATKDTEIPAFMKEGWLQDAVRELDRANLTPEQRSELEMIIAGNMSEKEAIEEKIKLERIDALEEAAKSFIAKGLLSNEDIALNLGLSIERVIALRKINDKK